MFSEVTGTDSADQGFREEPSVSPSSQSSKNVRERTLFTSDLNARNSELTDPLSPFDLLVPCLPSASSVLCMFARRLKVWFTIERESNLSYIYNSTNFLNSKLVLLQLAHI